MNLIPIIACALSLAQAPAPKPQVMVLGTYHMANPGLDLVKSQIRDTLGAERQKEIEELVDRLAKFKPTKILVEDKPNSPQLKQRFDAYVAGKTTLTANEKEQVGFRLARRLGLPGVIGIDHKLDMDFGKVIGYAQQKGMTDLLQWLNSATKQVGALMEDLDKKYTVPQLLAIHNHPAMQLTSQQLYIKLLQVAGDDAYPGADMLAGWYQRNLRIFVNIQRNLVPGDRVIVLIGSGHAYYLNQTVKESPTMQHVDPLKYLPKPPVVKFSL